MQDKYIYIVIGFILAISIIANYHFYSGYSDKDEEIEKYRNKLKNSEERIAMKNKEIKKQKEIYKKDIRHFQKKANKLQNEINNIENAKGSSKEFFLSMSDEESINTLENNIDTTLKVDTAKRIAFLPTLKAKEINYTYKKYSDYKIINNRQKELISYKDSLVKRQRLHIDTLNDDLSFFVSKNDSLVDFSKGLVDTLEKTNEENKKLKKQRRILFWVAILEFLGLVIIKSIM